ncbi:MAG: hypothetical protein H0U77_00150 [Nocardioidaceae bacterium]|nr:hypothetical protein [Nocardioidaceae bacterium]
MTSEPGGDLLDPEGRAMLRSAASALSTHVDERWVEVADALVSRALTTSRPSPPVRASATSGSVLVTEQVLVSHLRASMDPFPECETVAITIETDGDSCTGAVIALAVRFGTELIPLADRVRAVVEDQLGRLLGPVVPPVTVSSVHVHVDDVTRGDPKLDVHD